jgi:parvulin-like peptidyl-prolyl isomerase
MKLTPLLVAAALAGTAFLGRAADAPAAAASKLDSLFEDSTVAKGKGFTVKQSELDEAFGELRAAYASRGQQIPEAQRPLIEYRLLDRLVASKMLTGMATDADKAEAQKRLDTVMAETLKKFPTPEAFEQQLKFTGMTLDQFKAKTLEQLVWQTVLDRSLRPKFTVSEDDVTKFYKENPSKFEKPEMVKVNQILISTLDPSTKPPQQLPDAVKAEKLAVAKKVKERADKGEDFAALAKEFSDDPGTKNTGGEISFPRGTGRIPPEFEAAAFSLEPGKISDVVSTTLGYHVIKFNEKTPAEMVSLDKVHDDLKKGLESQEIQKRIPDFVEELKKENNVEILLPMPEELKNQPKP